jgi:hypothetical protein
MAYETKVILAAVNEILSLSEDLNDARERIERISNVENVVETVPQKTLSKPAKTTVKAKPTKTVKSTKKPT